MTQAAEQLADSLVNAVPLLHYDIMEGGINTAMGLFAEYSLIYPYTRYSVYSEISPKFTEGWAAAELLFERYQEQFLPDWPRRRLVDYHHCPEPEVDPDDPQLTTVDEDYCAKHCLIPDPEYYEKHDNPGDQLIKRLDLPSSASLFSIPDTTPRFWLRLAMETERARLIEIIAALQRLTAYMSTCDWFTIRLTTDSLNLPVGTAILEGFESKLSHRTITKDNYPINEVDTQLAEQITRVYYLLHPERVARYKSARSTANA